MSERVGERTSLSDEELLAAAPRGTRSREAQIGVFVLFGLIAVLVMLFWMTDPATLRGRYMLVTTVENAGGVRAGDGVLMHGVIIGRVHDFEMVEAGRVDITMEIDGRWNVPVGSRTIMGASGLFGGRTLEIDASDATQYYAEYDTMPGEGAGSEGLLGSVDDLSDQAGEVMLSINRLLDEETVGSVRGSARELEGLLSELSTVTREQRVQLQSLTASLNVAADGLEDASAAGPDIARAAARADSAMATLSVTSAKLDAATESLRSVLDRMDRGEGTLGRLSTDESLYVNLNTAAEALANLLADLQANPNKYINISIF
jgi:phospholipid/cholesterol/gamma-HCH transport system substrate-binding protein